MKFEKHKFQYHKSSILIDDVEFDTILICNKVSCEKGYTIGCKEDGKVKPFYVKCFQQWAASQKVLTKLNVGLF